MERALSYLADDIVCEAPIGRLTGIDAYRRFMTPFVSGLVSGELIDVLGDDEHAATAYVVETPFAKDYRGMEYVTVANGKITEILSVFDLSPALKAKAAAQG